MNLLRIIEQLFAIAGIEIAEPVSYDPEGECYLVTILVTTNVDGEQIPSDRVISKVESEVMSEYGDILVSRLNKKIQSIEYEIKSMLLTKFSNTINGARIIIESENIFVWVDPKLIQDNFDLEEIKLEVKDFINERFPNLKLKSVVNSSEVMNIPSESMCISVLRKYAPVTIEEIRNELLVNHFKVPNDEWLINVLKRWENGSLIHQRQDEKYVMTLAGLQAMGSSTTNWSPDVVRALNLTGARSSKSGLPHPSTECLGFLAGSPSELYYKLMGKIVDEREYELIELCFKSGIPPLTSLEAISAMLGFNKWFISSLLKQPEKYYREFCIPKGKSYRKITAPKVILKTIQKWLSIQFQKKSLEHDAAFGFVPGRSHLSAASEHLHSNWVLSMDIKNFFPSVSEERVMDALEKLGYTDNFCKTVISKLTCYNGGLAQGSPASPVLSNIVLFDLDETLSNYADSLECTYTRYADDIVISGKSEVPKGIEQAVSEIISDDGWVIADEKTTLDQLPSRLKVHGLLVHGENIRLTKGYRNRIRAYRHLLKIGKIRNFDLPRVNGHICYAESVENF